MVGWLVVERETNTHYHKNILSPSLSLSPFLPLFLFLVYHTKGIKRGWRIVNVKNKEQLPNNQRNLLVLTIYRRYVRGCQELMSGGPNLALEESRLNISFSFFLSFFT